MGDHRFARAARHPHVHVKVSGYHYFSRDRYPYAESRALVAAVLDAFGPERLLWGSDFPHVLLRSGYGRSLRLVGGEVSKQVDHADMARTRGADVDLFRTLKRSRIGTKYSRKCRGGCIGPATSSRPLASAKRFSCCASQQVAHKKGSANQRNR